MCRADFFENRVLTPRKIAFLAITSDVQNGRNCNRLTQ